MSNIPESIPADGSVDVTSALEDFITTVPDGVTVAFPAGGVYKIEDTINVDYRNGLTFEGNGSTLIATTVGVGSRKHSVANRSHLKFTGGSDLVVQNLNVTGANPNPGRFNTKYNSQHGIFLAGVKSALVEGCAITNVYGDSVYLGNEKPGSVNSPCEDIHVVGNTAVGAGRQGMTCNYGIGVWFEDNTIDNSGFTSFDFEPDTIHTPCSGIHILRNTIGSNGAVFLAAKGVAPVDDVEIVGNTSNVDALSIQAGGGVRQSNWRYLDNSCTAPNHSQRYLGFTSMDDITISGNALAVRNAAVRVNDCNRVSVMDNTFLGAQAVLEILQPGQQFYAGPSTDCTESGNTV